MTDDINSLSMWPNAYAFSLIILVIKEKTKAKSNCNQKGGLVFQDLRFIVCYVLFGKTNRIKYLLYHAVNKLKKETHAFEGFMIW